MTLTLTEAFDLPSPDELSALNFVVRLDTDADHERQPRLVSDYVLTPTVRAELPVILQGMRRAWERGEDLGRFIHGSFGSGKSHFMSFLGMLLEDRAVAWEKPDPLLGELDAAHRAWIRKAKLLVVRLHMLTLSREEASFDRVVYEAFNRALKALGKKPFEFLDVAGVIDEARREAAQYGDAFWHQAETAHVVGSREDFEALVKGSIEERESFARAYLEWKGRDPASAGVDPNWADGLQRMARHAREQGFGAVVLFIDEMLLWLSEKTGPEFKRAINQLNVMVDHTDGRRAVPLFVFVARQRNLSEFFPDMVQEDEMHQHLDHHSKRFELTTLQDVELRHICKERVLRPRRPAEVKAAVDTLTERHKKLLPSILQRADVGYLRDVYPFHPALIEALVDISSLMQRERTALRLLYELLVVRYPTLPLGELLPVGSAFEAIFPPEGVEGSKRVSDLQAVQRLYYQRFSRAMDAMVAAGTGFDAGRRKVLDQVVKTALLAEVSPRLKGASGLTVERLVQLNDVDIEGETDRGRMQTVYDDLLDLSRIARELQVTGAGRTAVVGVVLQGVNFGELMGRARTKVETTNARFRTFYGVFKTLFKAANRAELGQGLANEVEMEVKWRGTTRRGSLTVKNVRELMPKDFRPREGEAFRIVLDYPWDDPGHTVDEDRQRALDVRKQGRSYTMCWLPRHLTPTELDHLTELGAVDHLLTRTHQDELLANLGPHERQQVLDQATNLRRVMEVRVLETLGKVYKDHSEIVPLISEVSQSLPELDLGQNLEHLARELLRRQYPLHPEFSAEPTPEAMRTLCDWMVSAAESADQRFPFDDATGKVLRAFGMPLDVVNVGQTHATLKRDTRYIQSVLDHATDPKVAWAKIDAELEETYGLGPEVRSLFLVFLARAYGYRALNAAGESVELSIDRKPKGPIILVRAPLVDVAEWSRLRELGPALFGVERPTTHRTLAEQDRYARLLRERGTALRAKVRGLAERVAHLGAPASARGEQLAVVAARLAPLSAAEGDSFATLRALLAQWPDDASDPHRTALLRAEAVTQALDALDATARDVLLKACEHPQEALAVRAHLDVLRGRVGAGEQERPLTLDTIEGWNREARALIARVMAAPAAPTTNVARAPTARREDVTVMDVSAVDLGDGDALGELLGGLRAKLGALGWGVCDVEVTVRRRPGA